MRRRVVLAAAMILVLAAAIAWAQTTPRTVTMDPLVMTGTTVSTVPRSTVPFPKVTKMDVLQMTGLPPDAPPTVPRSAVPFPKTLKMDSIEMTGVPPAKEGSK